MITPPYVVEPICGGAIALFGTTGEQAGMDDLEGHALRIAASALPPPVILRDALVQPGPAAADGPSAAVACADGRSPSPR